MAEDTAAIRPAEPARSEEIDSSKADELRKGVQRLLKSTDGLLAIVITDKEGVPLLKVAEEDCPELALRPKFLCVFGPMSDQVAKMGMGVNKKIIVYYANYQVVQISCQPLLLTMIATQNAITGELIGLEKDLSRVIETLNRVKEMSENSAGH